MIRLATSPEPHIVSNARSIFALFKRSNMTATTHRSIPAPEPDPEPNPAPDAALNTRECDIDPSDWNVLFHAVTARLQASTGPVPLGQLRDHAHGHELGMTASVQATVLDCVESMNLLHAALPREWHQQHRP